MGLLRAVADAVVIGAGTLRASSQGTRVVRRLHLSTARRCLPRTAHRTRQARATIRNVVVTASGDTDLETASLSLGWVPSIIVTTAAGARCCDRDLPPSTRVEVAAAAGPLCARAVLNTVGRTRQSDVVLIEAGATPG